MAVATTALGVVTPAPTAHAGAASGIPRARVAAMATSAPAGHESATAVTLLTGDRVLLRRDQRGDLLTSLAPSSPHFGQPFERVHHRGDTWVVPSAAPALLRRLDVPGQDVGSGEPG